ncbi:Rne/Rng family ribonuclease [Calderihabitans maritimus]|uniref:Ribonuclease G n=1 Tax=Calderihabitans maritimus TaxID=1246530 RepID=A0A1Z5HVM0_9FIRM|nr:Rne/Rng family ribonuclease [Calderihabitans maritimus]GAW93330.1 ribonuclease, Rne/Rng family [Calderihabitans maritimus]
MYKEILIQVDEDETAVAVLENHLLVEIYLERSLNQRLVGNIYKGKVENVLPGMQAAFVDIGLDKNAFLFVEDALPARGNSEGGMEGRPVPSIDDVLKVGQEVIVQISKEPIGTKGARVTTRVTLPGRYVVLMPTVDYVGISRRIEDEAERERLKGLAQKVKPENMGVIVRTVADGMTTDALKSDVEALVALWKKIQNKAHHSPAPSLIHKDLGLLQRILRDLFTENVDRLLLNSRYAYEKVMDILDIIAPHLKNKVHLMENRDLFNAYNVTAQIEQALKRKVWLKCGGYIVIDQTEALTAIDVNTGKFVGSTNLADTVLKTNLEAAVEIARQLRLRNIGGIIIIDFIDMESAAHQEMVLKTLEEELRKDKTKTNVLGLTQLGLVELTRKKSRQGLHSVLLKNCPYCDGKGKVLSDETVSLRVKKEIKELAQKTEAPAILVEVNPTVASLLIGPGGSHLRELEKKIDKRLLIKGEETLHIEEVQIKPLYDEGEIDKLAVPVEVGQRLKVKIESPHSSNINDGIARVHGFVVDVAGAAPLIGQQVEVEVTKVFRTWARARLVSELD